MGLPEWAARRAVGKCCVTGKALWVMPGKRGGAVNLLTSPPLSC